MNQCAKIFFVIALPLIVAGCSAPKPAANNTPNTVITAPVEPLSANKIASLAKALTAAGARMYGSEFCSACKYQKQLFAEAWKFVTYANCDVSATSGVQNAACKAAGIKLYPTWEFKDGSRLEGVQQFEVLAQKIGFTL